MSDAESGDERADGRAQESAGEETVAEQTVAEQPSAEQGPMGELATEQASTELEPAEQAPTEQVPAEHAPMEQQPPTEQTPLPQSVAPLSMAPPPDSFAPPSMPSVSQQGYPQAGYPQPPVYGPQPPAYGPPPPAYGYAEYVAQNPYSPALDRAGAKRKRRRLLWILGAAVVVLGLISVGIYALLPGRTGNSLVAEVTCRPADLSSCLIKAPAGAVRLSSSSSDDDWPQQTVSSASQFAANIVTDSAGVGGSTQVLLGQDGVTTIAHNDWNAVDGDNVDLVLLAFSTQKGAQEWNSTRDGEILAAYPGSSTAIPGDAADRAHAAVKADSKGLFDAAYSTVAGRIVLDVAYSSPNQFTAPDLQRWAGTELASLRTAPAPAADPAPTAPGTEQAACGSGLAGCLMNVPSGGQAWSDPLDPNWISSRTLSPTQLVHLFWDQQSAADQQEVLANFGADGVTGISHEDWTVDNANEQADIYLVQTITAAGATQLATANFGEPRWRGGLSGTDYTIPGTTSDVEAWKTSTTDAQGFTDFSFTATFGNVIAVGWEYYYGSLDTSTANSWSLAQINRIQSSVQTVPMGLFPLAAPALPAASQGTCAASGDCLLPLPSGASDTTSTSYQITNSLSDGEYAGEYDIVPDANTTAWFDSDGFVSGEHRSFTASNGAAADSVLIKYRNPAQAQAAALYEYGVNASADRICTDAAVADSLCLADAVSTSDLLQNETIWVLAWKGDYEVSIHVTLSDSADVGQAYTWAIQQLDLVPPAS